MSVPGNQGPCSQMDVAVGSTPGSGRSPGGGNSNPQLKARLTLKQN